MDNEPEEIVLPSEIARFFKNPALLVTETQREYDSLFRGTAFDIDPKNNMEWFSMRNYVAAQWRIRRLEMASTSIINAALRPALRAILESILPETDDRLEIATRMAQEWYEVPARRTAMLELLKKHGLDENSILARAMEMCATELERLDVQLQRHKLAAMRELRQLASIRRTGLWPGTEDCGRRAKQHPNGNGVPAGRHR